MAVDDEGSERRNQQTLTFTVIFVNLEFFKAPHQPPTSTINGVVEVPSNNKQ